MSYTGPDFVQLSMLLAIALLNAFTAWAALRTKNAMLKVGEDVRTLELNTNSMKDALVKVTGEAAFAKGKEESRIEGVTKAAAVKAATDTKADLVEIKAEIVNVAKDKK